MHLIKFGSVIMFLHALDLYISLSLPRCQLLWLRVNCWRKHFTMATNNKRKIKLFANQTQKNALCLFCSHCVHVRIDGRSCFWWQQCTFCSAVFYLSSAVYNVFALKMAEITAHNLIECALVVMHFGEVFASIRSLRHKVDNNGCRPNGKFEAAQILANCLCFSHFTNRLF